MNQSLDCVRAAFLIVLKAVLDFGRMCVGDSQHHRRWRKIVSKPRVIASHRRWINDGVNQMADVGFVYYIIEIQTERVLVLGRMHLGVVERKTSSVTFLVFFSHCAIKRQLATIWT